MKTRHVLLLTAFAAAIAAASPMLGEPVDAQNPPVPSSGILETLPHGTYECALPGDAAGKAFEVVPAEEFQIEPASRYRTAQGSGTYILRGNDLTFTGGPKKGDRYKRVGINQLRKLDGGAETKLLCTRLVAGN
jgi:hypothetical protein